MKLVVVERTAGGGQTAADVASRSSLVRREQDHTIFSNLKSNLEKRFTTQQAGDKCTVVTMVAPPQLVSP